MANAANNGRPTAKRQVVNYRWQCIFPWLVQAGRTLQSLVVAGSLPGGSRRVPALHLVVAFECSAIKQALSKRPDPYAAWNSADEATP